MDDSRPGLRAVAGFAIAAAVLVGVPLALARVVDDPVPDTFTIEIPAGTAELLAAGQDVNLFPEELDFRLRDVLIIVNGDSVAHQIGPYAVEPGERLERTFGETASFIGFCSLHAGGEITIEVADG